MYLVDPTFSASACGRCLEQLDTCLCAQLHVIETVSGRYTYYCLVQRSYSGQCGGAGGDALASDLMWREIKKLAKDKPLVATMGDVAASGGYYMSMAAPTVLAHPLTITGSIGVVTGKFNLEELYSRVQQPPFLGALCLFLTSALQPDTAASLP